MGGEKLDDVIFSSAHVADKQQQDVPKPSVRFAESTKHKVPKSLPESRGRSRMSQPGTRKYKRFMSIVELLSDSEGEDLELEVEMTVEYRSPFTIIFEDDAFRQKWDPFIDITEEEEAKLLALLEANEAFRKQKKLVRDMTVPTACWRNLGKYAKKTIFEHHESPIFESLDKRMVDFIMSRSSQKTFPLTSHIQRLLCHCIAPYYSMTAHTIKNGATYYTTVTKTKATLLPSATLSQFVVTKLEQPPGR